MSLSSRPWIIVGAGRVGQTLALLADSLGIEVRTLWNRTEESSERAFAVTAVEDHRHGPLPSSIADALNQPSIVWLTVVDTHLPDVARILAGSISHDALVFMTSGSLSSQILRDAGIKAPSASVHPAQAITDPPRALPGLARTVWSIEGDIDALTYARALLNEIHVTPVHLDPEAKTLYHASAVTAANLLVSLIDAAIAIAREAGLDEPTARQMLVTLAGSSLENLREQRPAHALSGPVARGDEPTIAAHIEALKKLDDPDLLAIYELLTNRARTLH